MATTAGDLVKQAFFEAGIMDQPEQGIAPNFMTVGMKRLNLLTAQWSQRREFLQEVIEIRHTLTPGVDEYTIGPTGDIVTQRPIGPMPGGGITTANIFWAPGDQQFPTNLHIMSEEEWQPYRSKTITTGLPWAIYNDRGFPNSTLHVTGPPTAADVIQLYFRQAISQFASEATSFDMAPGYESAIQSTLAEYLCNSFKRPVTPELATQARNARVTLASLSSQPPLMSNDAKGMFIRQGNRGTWDWRTGLGY